MGEDGRFATYDTRIDPYLTPPPHPRLLTRGAASKPQRLRSTLSSKRSASVFMSNQPDREHEDGDRPSPTSGVPLIIDTAIRMPSNGYPLDIIKI